CAKGGSGFVEYW
nr:immunoglobulin heavy chain junction region [Macaca mulatta]